MTTTTTPSPASRAALPALDDRGTLTISDSTVERIAARAVTEIEGVGGAASRVLGVAVGGEDLDNTANGAGHRDHRERPTAADAPRRGVHRADRLTSGHHRHGAAHRHGRLQEGPVKRRPRRSIPATLTAVVLLAACAFVAVIAIQLLLGQNPWVSYESVAGTLHDARWNDLVPAIAGGGAALLGLALLLAAILPGKPTVLPLEGELDSGASRRSYRSTLSTAASTVDGVSAAKVKLKRRKVFAKVSTGRTVTDGLADAVRAAIEHRLDQIAPATRPAVKIKVHAARSAS